MDNQKVDLDIRVILAELNIEFERFIDWEENEYSESKTVEIAAQN